MCLAIPAKVVELVSNELAKIDLDGVRKVISVELVPEVKLGEYVIVHVDHAIGIVNPQEAQATLARFVAEVAR